MREMRRKLCEELLRLPMVRVRVRCEELLMLPMVRVRVNLTLTLALTC